MEYLPEEIINVLFSFLPDFKTQLAFRSVCKLLYSSTLYSNDFKYYVIHLQDELRKAYARNLVIVEIDENNNSHFKRVMLYNSVIPSVYKSLCDNLIRRFGYYWIQDIDEISLRLLEPIRRFYIRNTVLNYVYSIIHVLPYQSYTQTHIPYRLKEIKDKDIISYRIWSNRYRKLKPLIKYNHLLLQMERENVKENIGSSRCLTTPLECTLYQHLYCQRIKHKFQHKLKKYNVELTNKLISTLRKQDD